MKNSDVLEQEVLDVIRNKYNEIFSAEKKVADFILENPLKTVESNVSELAKLSGVSDATVVRMCHHVGYAGYYQFRITLARDIGKKQYEGMNLGNEYGEVEKLFRTYANNMIEIGKNISEKNIWECVKLLKCCNTVHLIAIGNTSSLSQYMGFRLGRLGIKASYGLSAEFFMNHINLASPDDIVIAISKSGSSIPVVLGMELAKEKGITTIAITAHVQSPISKLADQILLAIEYDATFNYYNGYAQLNMVATIDALLAFLTNEDLIQRKHADIPELLLSEYKV